MANATSAELPVYKLTTVSHWEKYQKLLEALLSDEFKKWENDKHEETKKFEPKDIKLVDDSATSLPEFVEQSKVWRLVSTIEQHDIWGVDEIKPTKLKTLFAPDTVKLAMAKAETGTLDKESIVKKAEEVHKQFYELLKNVKDSPRPKRWHINAGPTGDGFSLSVVVDDDDDEMKGIEDDRLTPENNDVPGSNDFCELQKYHKDFHKEQLKILSPVWDLLTNGDYIHGGNRAVSVDTLNKKSDFTFQPKLNESDHRLTQAEAAYDIIDSKLLGENRKAGLKWDLGIMMFSEWRTILDENESKKLEQPYREAYLTVHQWPVSVLASGGNIDKVRFEYPTKEEWEKARAYIKSYVPPEPKVIVSGDSGYYYVAFQSEVVSIDMMKPGETIDGHRIVAFHENHRDEVDEKGLTTDRKSEYRVYVVELKGKKGRYVIMDESECGGAFVWAQLQKMADEDKKNYLEIVSRKIDVFKKFQCNREGFQKYGWGVRWLATRPWIKSEPTSKPVSYVAVWRKDATGKEMSCAMSAGIMQQIVGPKLYEAIIARVIRVPGRPNERFTKIWDAYKAAAPVRPMTTAYTRKANKSSVGDLQGRLADVEQKMKQLAIIPLENYHQR